MKLITQILLFILPVTGWTQKPHSIMNYLTVEETADGVLISWEIEGGSTCNGMSVLRSGDDVNYEEIYDVAGICGNPGFAVDYSFIDTSPINQSVNYYKIKVGIQGNSTSKSIYYVDLGPKESLVFPQPIEENSVIRFSNHQNSAVIISVFNSNGRLINQITNYHSNEIRIADFELESGIFFFQILSESGDTVNGKLLIPN